MGEGREETQAGSGGRPGVMAWNTSHPGENNDMELVVDVRSCWTIVFPY